MMSDILGYNYLVVFPNKDLIENSISTFKTILSAIFCEKKRPELI